MLDSFNKRPFGVSLLIFFFLFVISNVYASSNLWWAAPNTGGNVPNTINANSTNYLGTDGIDLWFLTENLPANTDTYNETKDIQLVMNNTLEVVPNSSLVAAWAGSALVIDMSYINESILDKISTTYYNVTNMTNLEGTLTGGSESSVNGFNDGESYNVSEGNGAGNSVNVVANFTGVTSCTQLVYRAWYAGSSSHDIEVGMYDYTINDYEYNYHPISDSSGFLTYEAAVPDCANHISAGKLAVSFLHVPSFGVITHRFYLDYVILSSGVAVTSGGVNIEVADNSTDYAFAYGSIIGIDSYVENLTDSEAFNSTFYNISLEPIYSNITEANASQTAAELYNNSDEFNAIFFPALWSATTGNNTMLNLSMIDFAKNVNSSAIEVANASAFESAVNNITVADLDMRSNDINMLGGIGIGMTNDVNPIDILSSSSTGGIGWNSSVTNATLEQLRFTLRNYDSNNAQPFAYLGGVSDGTNNELRLGGGYGVNTAATSVKIYTGADYYTTTGTARLTIDNTGKSTFDGNLSFTGFWVTGAWSSLNSIGIGTDPSGTDPLSIITGSTGGILMQSVITNATSKEGRLKVGHYDTDLGTAIAFGMTNKPTANEMRWGGGYAANFAATDQIFYTGDDNYEFSGIERMHILPNGTTQFANGSITLEAGNLTIGDNGMDIKDMKGIGVPTNGMAFSSIAVPEAGLYFQIAGLNFTDKNGKTTFLIEYVAGAATGNVTVYADNSSAATCGAVKNGDNIDWACSVKGS